MGSVHEKPDERDLRYLKFKSCRHRGLEDKEIVGELNDPDIDSPPELYRRLKRDGFPVCEVCGDYSVSGEHCTLQNKERKPKARRGGGEAEQLPDAYGAAWLFRTALSEFQEDIDGLKSRRDYLKDDRFVAEDHLSAEDGESWFTYSRSGIPEEDWREFCRKHEQDPEQESFTIPKDLVLIAGVSQAPPEPLTRLIAMYILSGEPVEHLLEALHPRPGEVDREQLDQHINGSDYKGKGKFVGLQNRANSIARLLRGGTIPEQGGRGTGGLERREVQAATYITLQRSRGVADQEILQQLQEGHGFGKTIFLGTVTEELAWPDMTINDLRRLGKLGLKGIDA